LAEHITTLTPAQEVDIRRTYQEWLTVGRSTAPLDRAQLTHVLGQFYARIGEAAPSVLVFSSPAMCVLAFAALRALSAANAQQTSTQLRSQLGSQLGSQLDSQLWSQLGSQLDSQLRSQLGSQLGSQLDSQLRSQLRSQLWSQLRSQLRSQLWSQLRSQLRSQLDSQQSDNYFAGQQWCAWSVFYDFCRRIGVRYSGDEDALLDLWLDEARTCHWWWPHKGLVLASERPTVLHVDDVGRLHAEDGPAIAYADGWAIHAWHGVRVDPRVIEQPETLTPAAIKNEANAEVRRVMLARFGEDRFIRDGGATLVHQDACGALYDLGAETLAVRVLNSTPEPDGSLKPYWLYVHPELRPIARTERGDVELGDPQPKTAHNAVASTFGLRGEDYVPAVQS